MHRARPLVSGVCLAIAGACAAYRVREVLAYGPSDFDDAYMFLRYAQHLLDGHGLRWNIGDPPVHGVTSLLHLAVVAGSSALLPAMDGGRLIQLVSCAAGIAAVAVMAIGCVVGPERSEGTRRIPVRQIGPERSEGTRRIPVRRLPGNVWMAALAPLILFTEPFTLHARTGMDTMLSLLANSALALATLHLAARPTPRTALLAAAAAYACVLARPDNIVVAILCPVLALLLFSRPRAPLVTFCVTIGALLLIGGALETAWLGTPLPLAFHAKRPGAYAGFAGEYSWNPFLFLKVFLAAALPFLAVLLVLVGRDRWRVPVALLAPVLATAIALLFGINQIMGHLGRFYFPFLPFIVVSAAWTLDRWMSSPRPGARWWAARIAAAAVVILAAGPALEAAGRRHESRPVALADLGGYLAAPLPEMDSWQASIEVAALARAAPAGTVLAMSEHGLVGARAPAAQIVDVLGLHDPDFRRFSAATLWHRRPDVIWMPHPDHTQMVRDILDSEELWARYDFYPGAFTYGLALRRDSPRFPVLFRLFEERWRAAYPGRSPANHLARRAPRE